MESKRPRFFSVDMNGYEAFKGFMNFIQMMGKTWEHVFIMITCNWFGFVPGTQELYVIFVPPRDDKEAL